jgi:hypothetical protein
MDLIPVDLQAAARSARDRVVTLSQASAASGVGPHASERLQGTMAATARAAIFADALLSAMRARFEELRTVAK